MLDSTFFYAGLAALGVGLLIVMLMAMPRKQKPLTGADLASTYASRVGGVKSGEDDPAAEAALAQATATAERVLGASKNLETRIADRLDAAGNPFKPAEWLLLHVGVFVVMGLIGLLLGGGSLVLGLDLPRARRPRPVDVPRLQAQRGARRSSSRCFPTRSS